MPILEVGPGKAYTTIASAWAASANNDTLDLFTDSFDTAADVGISLAGKTGITIQAHVGETPVIDGLGAASNLWDFQIGVAGLALDGLRFQNCVNANVVLRSGVDAVMTDCYHKLGALGNYCVYCIGNNVFSARGSTFCQYDDGTAPASSTYGLYVQTGCTIDVDDWCEFHTLSTDIAVTGGTASGTVQKSLLRSHNWATGTTYGFSNAGTGLWTFRNSLIVGKSRGLYNAATDDTLVVQNCLFDLNTTGLYVLKYAREISNCIIMRTVANGIYGDGGGDQPVPDSCSFYSNQVNALSYTTPVRDTGGNPQFVNLAGHNYRLNSYVLGADGRYQRTPCVNAGAVLAAVTEDYDGNPRGRGGFYDVGPFENQGSGNIYTNRARHVVSGLYTYWYSPDAADSSMAFHPSLPALADYTDFVVTLVRKLAAMA